MRPAPEWLVVPGPWGGAAGEQDGQVAATVHRATDTIPHRRIMLPFVDEDRFVDAEQGIRVGAQC